MAEEQVSVNFVDIPTPSSSIVGSFYKSNGDNWAVKEVHSISGFSLNNGRMEITLSVSGTIYKPGPYDPEDFGPVDWIFYVVGSRGISLAMDLQTDEGDSTGWGNLPSVKLSDLSGPDAENIQEYVRSERYPQAIDLLDQIL